MNPNHITGGQSVFNQGVDCVGSEPTLKPVLERLSRLKLPFSDGGSHSDRSEGKKNSDRLHGRSPEARFADPLVWPRTW